jgi:hypothetical protein
MPKQLSFQAQRSHQQEETVGGYDPGVTPVNGGDGGRTVLTPKNRDIAEDFAWSTYSQDKDTPVVRCSDDLHASSDKRQDVSSGRPLLQQYVSWVIAVRSTGRKKAAPCFR